MSAAAGSNSSATKPRNSTLRAALRSSRLGLHHGPSAIDMHLGSHPSGSYHRAMVPRPGKEGGSKKRAVLSGLRQRRLRRLAMLARNRRGCCRRFSAYLEEMWWKIMLCFCSFGCRFCCLQHQVGRGRAFGRGRRSDWADSGGIPVNAMAHSYNHHQHNGRNFIGIPFFSAGYAFTSRFVDTLVVQVGL